MSDTTAMSADLERLLEYLKASRGFDFSSYKRTTLGRRIEKRMQAVGCATFDDYQDHLEVHQDEFPALFNTILINVTSFFRDEEAWNYVRDVVVPGILAEKPGAEPIRVWVAGCATGQEACTIAILFAEAMGRDAFLRRVKIYATDLDDDALSCSRAASYTEKEVENVPPEFLDRYFEPVSDRFAFDREMRRALVYGRLDLLGDAPISRVDLLTCRNTLMYFNAEAQDRIVQRFHFALNDGGFLLLGKAETMLSHNDLFNTSDLRHRVFTKVPRSRLRDRGFMYRVGGDGSVRRGDGLDALRDGTFEGGNAAQIVLDLDGRLMLANERARYLLAVNRADVGSPIQDLDVSFRPVELRAGIEQVQASRRPARHRDIVWTAPSGEGYVFDVSISLVRNAQNAVVGTSVVFEDITLVKRLQNELQSFRQELETAYEEVQSTNEELQTTNEELQSTVEELETTNEEIQSTSEELETMNEELQSANEELQTINEELRLRSIELNHANGFMESVLSGLRDSVIVLDAEFQVLAWNATSEDLWGLRADEALGKHLLNLDIGLPTDDFRGLVRACLATGEPQRATVEALNRRGRKIACTVDFTALRGTPPEGRGVIILTTCTSPAGA